MQEGAQPAGRSIGACQPTECDQIANMRAAGHTKAEIARATGRSDGTI